MLTLKMNTRVFITGMFGFFFTKKSSTESILSLGKKAFAFGDNTCQSLSFTCASYFYKSHEFNTLPYKLLVHCSYYKDRPATSCPSYPKLSLPFRD